MGKHFHIPVIVTNTTFVYLMEMVDMTQLSLIVEKWYMTPTQELVLQVVVNCVVQNSSNKG